MQCSVGEMRGCTHIQHLFRIIISLQAINSDICQYREYCAAADCVWSGGGGRKEGNPTYILLEKREGWRREGGVGEELD
jgi:hypothetical protein